MSVNAAIQKSLELCREPALALRDGSVAAWNRPAETMFRGISAGDAAGKWFPPALLREPGEDLVCAAELEGKSCTIRMIEAEELRLISVWPEEEPQRGILSDGVLVQLQSTLTSLQFAVSLLRGEAPQNAETLSIVRRSCYSLQRQIGNLQTITALREGSYFFRASLTELRELLRELCLAASDLMEEGPRLRCELPDAPVFAWLDRELFYLIVLNLLSNSYGHTPAEGEITVTLECNGSAAILTVADRGEGIPADVLGNVFRRYTQRATPEDLRPACSGGLGLYLASLAAQRHGGTMVVSSRPGEGATVTVSLPLGSGETRMQDVMQKDRPLSDLLLTEFSGLLKAARYEERWID